MGNQILRLLLIAILILKRFFWQIVRIRRQKSLKEFQLFLGNEDKLNQLNQIYSSLVDVFNIEKSRLFNAKYEVFDILTEEGV